MQDMSRDDQVSLTLTIMGILDEWGLKAEAMMSILGLPQGTPARNLRKFRDGTPFPFNAEMSEHLEHLVGIATALRTSYPMNPAMGTLWMRQSNRLFDDRAPLLAMAEDGLKGLVAVRSHLDCTYDWQMDSERAGRL